MRGRSDLPRFASSPTLKSAMNDLHEIVELLTMMVLDARTGTLIALLLVAAVLDWRTMRIPNWLTLTGMLLGMVANATHSTSIAAGLGTAAGGLALGLALFLPLWMLRILGAGDVKLMAMVGSFMGPWSTMSALLYVVVTGGIAALLFAAWRGALGRLAQNLYFIVGISRMPAGARWQGMAPTGTPSVGTLPYGISICIGTIAYLVTRQFGFA